MTFKYHWILAVLVGAANLAPMASFSETAWSQWRGPQRNGQSPGEAWPDSLDKNRFQQMWRVELGPSYSGPIVSDRHVFTTESKDEKFEVVRAYDRATGQERWSHQWEGGMRVPFFARANGDWIRSTPALDGDRLYVAGMRDVLVCLDALTGEEIWRVDFVKQLGSPPPSFGFVCSPLVDGKAVYVQAGARLAKLDKLTGDILWQSLQDEGDMVDSAFSSPVMVDLAGRRQLVVQTRQKLAGVDPDDGKVLWEQDVKAFRGMNILTPVVHKDVLFTSSYGGKTIGFKVTHAAGNYVVEEAWRHKAQGYMSTPVIIDGVAYTHLKSQRLMAIEMETGRELWTSDQSFGKYMSLVARGDRILALDQRGLLLLWRANREKLDILDQREITDAETWAHVAVVDGEVFVRELHALTMFQWQGMSPTP